MKLKSIVLVLIFILSSFSGISVSAAEIQNEAVEEHNEFEDRLIENNSAGYTVTGGEVLTANETRAPYFRNLEFSKQNIAKGEKLIINLEVYEENDILIRNSVTDVTDPNDLFLVSSLAISKMKNDGYLEDAGRIHDLSKNKDGKLICEVDTTSYEEGIYAVSSIYLLDSYKNESLVIIYPYDYAQKITLEDKYVFRITSQESMEKVDGFVNRLYEKTLGRTPDATGLNYHMDKLLSKQVTGIEVARGFVFSDEVKNKNLSNTQFIEMLYQSFMGRNSDKAGLSYWKNMLDNGVSREYIFRGFGLSNEFASICKSAGITVGSLNLTEPRDQNTNLTMFVSRLYGEALGRTADIEGLNYYAQEILLKRVTPVQASQNFIFSPEFKNKNLSNTDYVKVLYRTFMGREFDQSGLNYHLNRMKNGTSREEILLGFANSPEFKNIMSGFGL